MIDIRQTDDGDVDLTTGDIVLIESTEQHQRDILIAAPGYYKEAPTVGVDSARNILESNPAAYLRNVRKQFAKDGMRVESVEYNNGNLNVQAEYEDNNQ